MSDLQVEQAKVQALIQALRGMMGCEHNSPHCPHWQNAKGVIKQVRKESNAASH